MAKDRLADWDSTAASNTDIGGINIDEGWPPENVNNAARETMAQVADFFKDKTGTITSTGTGGTYAITSNDGVTAYAAGQLYAFIANHANTGAATLNINAIGAKSIVKNHDLALESGDIEANQICIVAYGATDDTFQILSQMAQVVTEGANVDIANTTAETDIDKTADSVLVYDSSATANREAVLSDVVGLDRDTVQATTSGSSKTFTIAGAKRATVVFEDCSLNGTDNILVQLATGGGTVTSGYDSTSLRIPTGSTPVAGSSSAGFNIKTDAASFEVTGSMTIHNITGTKWVSDHTVMLNAAQAAAGGGYVDISAAVTDLIVTVSGANAFDNGEVNVFVEY